METTGEAERERARGDCAHVRGRARVLSRDAHDHAGHAHAHHEHGAHDHHASHHAGTRALRAALVVTGVLLVAEVVGGFMSNSLALLADAGHMLTDVGALALSLFVAWFSRQPSTPRKTYGYLRWEILAAFLNGGALLVISAMILWEAAMRLRAPEPLGSGIMLAVALLGLVVNVVAARLLHGHAHDSLNMRGAYLHVLGDLLGSVGVVVAAIVVRTTGWLAADPVASIVTTLLIVRGAWRLVRESVDVLLEAVPSHISLPTVRRHLEAIGGVESVHDLHVWSVTSGLVAMSAHAVVPAAEDQQRVVEDATSAMRALGIGHVTVQVERAAIRDCCD